MFCLPGFRTCSPGSTLPQQCRRLQRSPSCAHRRRTPYQKLFRKKRRKWPRPCARTSPIALIHPHVPSAFWTRRHHNLQHYHLRRTRTSQQRSTVASSLANTAENPSRRPMRLMVTRRTARSALRKAEKRVRGHRVTLLFFSPAGFGWKLLFSRPCKS